MTATLNDRTKYLDALLNGGVMETYKCGRALNDRGTILVYLHKGRRYDSRTKLQTTAAKLAADGWNLIHRMETK